MDLSLDGKTILITGAARRLGRSFALACARAGADIAIHHGTSEEQAQAAREEVLGMGRKAWVFQADLGDPSQVQKLIPSVTETASVYGLVNSAAIFEPLSLDATSYEDWQRHIQINLTAPFLLSQAFASQAQPGARIVNMLDWRALRPGADHFPYTISKAALAGLTRSLAIALAPDISVNGLALGAILPPSGEQPAPDILTRVPLRRWAQAGDVEAALLFLLAGPSYITGEIIHVDGGRHLV